MTRQFVAGQRWVNHAELQLGLGTVMSVEHRTLTLAFPAAGETRTYARQSAPLSRVEFSPGDRIRDVDGNEICIESVHGDVAEVLRYTGYRLSDGTPVELYETRIDPRAGLHRPRERLLAGLVDENRWFELRLATRNALARLGASATGSLIGCRTGLIPHQLYIASEVSRRHAPRILLADEVGLGKTIEAGLILHQQLYQERIRRALIVVPESLLYQWLVEMLRKFNLRFSIYNSERYRDSLDADGGGNPFCEDPLVLCALETLVADDTLRAAVEAAGWDMLIVDEAHRLAWTREAAGEAYTCIETLARRIPAVLLLTATPEQLGRAGHFARLRLLDPDRFHDYEAFLEEEQHYEPVARAIDTLLNADEKSFDAAVAEVCRLLGQSPAAMTDREALINELLDRHGTGRVLFRNTRAAVGGFPERRLHTTLLTLPPAWQSLTNAADEPLLYPEQHWRTVGGEPDWTRMDVRLDWLRQLLEQTAPDKLVIICADRETAIDIGAHLRTRAGVPAALFHEEMSLLERDRAAAWFAAEENAARVLVCSEIGSEGRNFQFARHLVLFDLPVDPDLLEQRIGRLDRIGQRHTVEIHVPCYENTAQHVLLRWYDEGLSAFTRPCQTGQAVATALADERRAALGGEPAAVEAFIRHSRELNQTLLQELEQGRDRLLELHSCRPAVANALLQEAREADVDPLLEDTMERIFDCFGVHVEEHGDRSLILSPAENMVSVYPGLPDEGLTVTFDRATALAHEDRQFLSWTHPLVITGMDIVLGAENGNTALIALSHPKYEAGTLLVECLYVFEAARSEGQARLRQLPPCLLRRVVDDRGRDHAGTLGTEVINTGAQRIETDMARQVIALKSDDIKALLDHAERLAHAAAPALLAGHRQTLLDGLDADIRRLQALSAVNPNVRADEIAGLISEREQIAASLDAMAPRLDALRVIVMT